jgi:hypothetical protein
LFFTTKFCERGDDGGTVTALSFGVTRGVATAVTLTVTVAVNTALPAAVTVIEPEPPLVAAVYESVKLPDDRRGTLRLPGTEHDWICPVLLQLNEKRSGSMPLLVIVNETVDEAPAKTVSDVVHGLIDSFPEVHPTRSAVTGPAPAAKPVAPEVAGISPFP